MNATDKVVLTLEQTISGHTFKYTIESGCGDLVMDDFINDMVRPLFLAVGFHPDSVNEYFNET